MRVRPSNRAGRPSSVSLRRATFTLREPPREPAAPLPGWLSLVRAFSLRTSGTAPGKDWSATGRRRLVGGSGIVACVGTGDWARRIAPGPTRAGRYRGRAVVRRRSGRNVRISCVLAGPESVPCRESGGSGDSGATSSVPAPPVSSGARYPGLSFGRDCSRMTDFNAPDMSQPRNCSRMTVRGAPDLSQPRNCSRMTCRRTTEPTPTAPGTRAPAGPPRPPRRTQLRPATSTRRARRPRRRCRGPWSRGWPAGGRRPSGPSGCRGR